MSINRNSRTYLLFSLLWLASIVQAQNRTYDGYGNNEANPHFGAVGSEFRYITPISFADGIKEPTGFERPNPREVSNVLFAQPDYIYDQHELSDFVWVFGQFIDHDITLVEDSDEPAFIPVPTCDPIFDPACMGQSMVMMMRTQHMEGSGTSTDNPRSYANEISAFIDGSAVYGSTEERALWLRSMTDGKLKVSEGNLLPFNTLNGEINGATDPHAPEMAQNDPSARRNFVAGDVRANENVMLLAMHTLFVREHNRICDQLKVRYPNGTDEQLYQKARKMIGGMIQSIVYNEWLPSMGVILDDYSGYDASINPSISNVFSAAGFRFGHTLLSRDILRMDDGCNTIAQGDMTLRDAFFKPNLLISSGLDPLVKGMSAQIQQALDSKVIDDVRNFLFGPPGLGFGLDLAAININRGRERGLMDYNGIRDALGIGKVKSFSEICEKPEDAQVINSLYSSVDDLDPWVGMLAEEHMPDAIFGETIMTIMKEQFRALRDGDRFYYLIDPALSSEEVEEIKNSRLSDIIRRNTQIEAIQNNVFKMQRSCHDLQIRERHLELLVFPNPTEGNFDLTLFSFDEGDANLVIRNLLGQVIDRQTLVLEKGINSIKSNFRSGTPTGQYSLEVRMGHEFSTLKVFKKN